MDTSTENLPTVDELEKALAPDPTNLLTRGDLVEALFDRFLFEDGPEADLKRVQELLKEAPDDKLLYERAYLSFVNGNDAVGLQKLREAATQVSQAPSGPFTSDELWEWITPLDAIAPAEAFEVMADAFSAAWPDSPVVLTLKALAAADNASALDSYLKALQVDGNYSLAAIGCADCYANSKDWVTASEYYRRALASDTAAESAELWFDAAVCQGKLKRYPEEAESYQKCLELAPDYPFARNNLGWALMKAGGNQEAVPVLLEAITRGNDGKYPMRNLANALEKLGRYEEAVEVLNGDKFHGQLTVTAKRNIARLEALSGSPNSKANRQNTDGT